MPKIHGHGGKLGFSPAKNLRVQSFSLDWGEQKLAYSSLFLISYSLEAATTNINSSPLYTYWYTDLKSKRQSGSVADNKIQAMWCAEVR